MSPRPTAPATRERPCSPARTASYVVITPARNEAAHLGHTIRSLVHQTVRPRRWVIVDDGPRDRTAAIVQAAAAAHPLIRLPRRPPRPDPRGGGGLVRASPPGAHAAVEPGDMSGLCRGGRAVGSALAREIGRAFVQARFGNEERHVRRLRKIRALERELLQPYRPA